MLDFLPPYLHPWLFFFFGSEKRIHSFSPTMVIMGTRIPVSTKYIVGVMNHIVMDI